MCERSMQDLGPFRYTPAYKQENINLVELVTKYPREKLTSIAEAIAADWKQVMEDVNIATASLTEEERALPEEIREIILMRRYNELQEQKQQ